MDYTALDGTATAIPRITPVRALETVHVPLQKPVRVILVGRVLIVRLRFVSATKRVRIPMDFVTRGRAHAMLDPMERSVQANMKVGLLVLIRPSATETLV